MLLGRVLTVRAAKPVGAAQKKAVRMVKAPLVWGKAGCGEQRGLALSV